MKWRREGEGLALATLAWSAAWCGDLIAAWRHAPYDRAGVVAALAWGLFVARLGRRAEETRGGWLGLAWACSFIGIAGDLNVARHAAVAFAGAAWAGGGWGRGAGVVLLAAGWMPALGWAGRGLGADGVNGLRLAMAAGALAMLWRWRGKPLS